MQSSVVMPRPFIRITPDQTVGELTGRYPDTRRLFRVCGIDAAAHAPLALDAIAELHQLELEDLLRAVSRAAERS